MSEEHRGSERNGEVALNGRIQRKGIALVLKTRTARWWDIVIPFFRTRLGGEVVNTTVCRTFMQRFESASSLTYLGSIIGNANGC